MTGTTILGKAETKAEGLISIRAAAAAAYSKVVSAGGANERAQQIDMIADISTAFDEARFAILESLTGTGKTMSMLIPAFMFAVTNNRQVVIATPQKALQQQTVEEFHKWLKNSGHPTLKKGRIALLKGRGNYMSRPALQDLVSQYADNPAHHRKMKQFEAFVDSCGGDIDFIKGNGNVPDFISSGDIEDLALPEDADPANDYYLDQAQLKAQDAHVVVTNHFLLLSYMQQRMFKRETMLPLDHMIIDEAHSLISSAFSFLSSSIALRTITGLLRQFARHIDKESFRGANALSDRIQEAIAVTSNVSQFFEQTGQARKASGKPELYIRDIDNANADDKVMKDVKKASSKLYNTLNELNIGKHKKHLRGVLSKHFASKLSDAVGQVKQFLGGFEASKSGNDIYFILTFSRDRSYPSFSRVKPSVGLTLYSHLWQHARSVVFTSGTLSDFNSSYAPFTGTRQKATFQHLRSELGLNMVKTRFVEYAYKRPFSFDGITVHLYPNAPLYSVDDDETKSRERHVKVMEFASDVIEDSVMKNKPRAEGGAMVLVPAYEDISILTESLALGAKIPKRQVIAQGSSNTLQMCLSEFKHLEAPEKGLLLLTGGWQGVDLPGKELTELFIPRIPRSNPTDPQIIARQNSRIKSMMAVEDYRQRTGAETRAYRDKGNYLGLFTEDAWKFKQGIGRLCRKEGDKGNIHIMDGRLFVQGNFKHILAWIQITFPHIKLHKEVK